MTCLACSGYLSACDSDSSKDVTDGGDGRGAGDAGGQRDANTTPQAGADASLNAERDAGSSDGRDGSASDRDGAPPINGDAGPRIVDAGPRIGPQSPGDEGWPCESVSQCNDGFACVENVFDDVMGNPIGVCARACKTNPDCNDDEKCFSYTGRDQDAHCVNVIADEYALCGVGDTSVCDKRSCLYFPNSPFGVCVDICALDGEDADGGAPAADVVSCSGAETCVGGVLTPPTTAEGVCGTVVGRGIKCGIDVGKYCNPGDICAPEDPNDSASTPRCFENCSDTGSCQAGQCVVVQQQFAACM
jgi:hypothetical protein